MELSVTADDMRSDGEADQDFVGFEADRIAHRRDFEDDQSALIKGKAAIR